MCLWRNAGMIYICVSGEILLIYMCTFYLVLLYSFWYAMNYGYICIYCCMQDCLLSVFHWWLPALLNAIAIPWYAILLYHQGIICKIAIYLYIYIYYNIMMVFPRILLVRFFYWRIFVSISSDDISFAREFFKRYACERSFMHLYDGALCCTTATVF